jgi:NTP pyrophosphatase (non-canonical NTP hydrolase)
VIDLDSLSAEVRAHVERLWPGEDIRSAGLSLTEEAGEVARAIVKRHHKTRGSREDWTKQLRIEVAQVVGVCMDIAEREGFSLELAVRECVDLLCVMDRNHDPVGSK